MVTSDGEYVEFGLLCRAERDVSNMDCMCDLKARRP